MAVPKRKTSRTKSKIRRYNYYKKIIKQVPFLGLCSNCENKKLPHKVCSECGYYKNKQVLNLS